MTIHRLYRIDGGLIFAARGLTLAACIERAVDFGVNLENADFSGLNLSDMSLNEGLLDGADFSGSELIRVDFINCRMKQTKFIRTHFEDVYLCENTRLESADFTGSTQSGGRTDKIPWVAGRLEVVRS